MATHAPVTQCCGGLRQAGYRRFLATSLDPGSVRGDVLREYAARIEHILFWSLGA